ncbi:MAG: response regulator transcription factor [Paludibacteraceae bacterium]|nr:response regulator transcription factor [Paludibacteraceae bacterium]
MNIIIVDDHPLFRIGTKMAIQRGSHTVVGEASNATALRQLLNDTTPDLILLDIILGNGPSGVDIARQLKADKPEIKILVLSIDTSLNTIKELLEIGIDGFVSKNAPDDEVLQAIDAVSNGQPYFGTDIDRIVQAVMTTQQLKNDLFSEREQEIIRAICQGGSNKDIAQKTNISLRTVETHKTNIFRKIGITNSVDLVLYAIKNGIVTI